MSGLDFENPNFFKNKNIKKLSKNVYLYENFVTENFQDHVMDFLIKQDEDSLWKQHGNYEIGDNTHDWFYDKVSLPLQTLTKLLDDLEVIMNPEFWGINHIVINKLEKGQSFNKKEYLSLEEGKALETDASWVSGVYFGDWSGGEVCFPNDGLEVKVRSGDLLIFSAKDECTFYVKEVTDGTRYCHYGLYYKHQGWLMP